MKKLIVWSILCVPPLVWGLVMVQLTPDDPLLGIVLSMMGGFAWGTVCGLNEWGPF